MKKFNCAWDRLSLIGATGWVDDGLVVLVYRWNGWQNWLSMSIPHDAKRFTLHMRFLFSCVDLSPRPHRAQAIGCLGTASALFLLWSTSSLLCSRIYDAQLTKAYGTDRTQNEQPELKNSWKRTTHKKGAGKPACPVGWPACPALGVSWPLGRLAGQWRTGLAGLLSLGPWNSSLKSEVRSNCL
jgi:hypothetical protein